MAYDPPQVVTEQTWIIGTWYQASLTRLANVIANITITTSATLVAGNVGRIIFDTADDNTGTNLVSKSSADSGLSAGLVIPGSIGSVTSFGNVMPGKWFRFRATAPVGSATYASFNPNTNTSTANSAFGQITIFG